jgi:hypothetical protein
MSPDPSYLDARGYASRSFYGISFGGVLLLDALRDDNGAKLLIIDSSPSRLSDHGCPPEHDPVQNFPSHGADALAIDGQRDNVVSPAMSHALVERARQAGAQVVISSDNAATTSHRPGAPLGRLHPFPSSKAGIHPQSGPGSLQRLDSGGRAPHCRTASRYCSTGGSVRPQAAGRRP